MLASKYLPSVLWSHCRCTLFLSASPILRQSTQRIGDRESKGVFNGKHTTRQMRALRIICKCMQKSFAWEHGNSAIIRFSMRFSTNYKPTTHTGNRSSGACKGISFHRTFPPRFYFIKSSGVCSSHHSNLATTKSLRYYQNQRKVFSALTITQNISEWHIPKVEGTESYTSLSC